MKKLSFEKFDDLERKADSFSYSQEEWNDQTANSTLNRGIEESVGTPTFKPNNMQQNHLGNNVQHGRLKSVSLIETGKLSFNSKPGTVQLETLSFSSTLKSANIIDKRIQDAEANTIMTFPMFIELNQRLWSVVLPAILS